MIKRENDFEKTREMQEIKNKYNLEELFNRIVLQKDKEEDKDEKKTKKGN